jgi:hypothetical protein
LTKTYESIKELVKGCIKELRIDGIYRVEVTEGSILDYPGEEIFVSITFDSQDNPIMTEINELHELRKRIQNILLSEGYILDHLLLSGTPEGVIIHGPAVRPTTLGKYFMALDKIQAEVRMRRGEMRPKDAVKHLMDEFGITLGAANSAVYLYRKYRHLTP